jgi:hypothetical protein
MKEDIGKYVRFRMVTFRDSSKGSKHQECWPVYGKGSNVQEILEKDYLKIQA